MAAEVSRRNQGAVFAVADAHGELIALLRMDSARLSSVTIATNKAFSAAREETPSGAIGARSRDAKDGFDIAYFGDSRFIGWGGGVPVMHEGECIGAVAVSGLPEADDVVVANLGVAAILNS